jgi:HEAT repeat protein
MIFLDSADSDVRIAAAVALGRLGDRRAVEPLFRACMDEDMRVKQAALEALSRLGSHNR